MRLRSIVQLITASALVASPIAATAAPIANPAASLSLAPTTRAATSAQHGNALAGGIGIFAALIAAGIVAIIVISVVRDDEKSKSP